MRRQPFSGIANSEMSQVAFGCQMRHCPFNQGGNFAVRQAIEEEMRDHQIVFAVNGNKISKIGVDRPQA